jgi:uncharacterized protein (DUF697 family)
MTPATRPDRPSFEPPFAPGVGLALAEAGRVRAEALAIVKSHVITASGVGLVPLPLIDGVALMDVQLNLVGRLADHYGVPFTRFYPTLATSLLAGGLPVLAAAGGGSLLKVIPGFGSLAAGATVSTLAAATTYAIGKVLVDHFDAGGTLQDVCPAAFRRQFRLELKRGRRTARDLVAAGAPA